MMNMTAHICHKTLDSAHRLDATAATLSMSVIRVRLPLRNIPGPLTKVAKTQALLKLDSPLNKDGAQWRKTQVSLAIDFFAMPRFLRVNFC